MKAIVTGVTGQDGAYLTQLLLEKGYTVYGTYRRTSSVNFWRMEDLGVQAHPQLHLVEHDLTDLGSSIALLQKASPDEIYNLAAQSFVGVSFDQPNTTAQITGVGALNLLEAIRLVNPKIRFYQASTSEMFGKVTQIPQTEKTSFHPRSPYGVSKTFAHYTTLNYREAYGMHASSGILFNHEGEFRGFEFVTRKITSNVAKIVHGKIDKFSLGSLHPLRDWGYAGDYVEAMWKMLQQETPEDYVIATGVTHSVEEFLLEALRVAGLDQDIQKYVDFDESLQRPAEVDILVGDASKAKEKLDWEPRVDFKKLVEIMVENDLKIEASA